MLLLVLVIVAMLALASFGFSDLMLNERRAAQTTNRQSQVRSLARSGAQLARQFLDRTPADQTAAGGIYDNAGRFSKQVVLDSKSPRDKGTFSVVAPKITDSTVEGVRYGLQDECTRINLANILNFEKLPAVATMSSSNTITGGTSSMGTSNAENMLVSLPGMTQDVADAILDWIDADDNPRDQGAESDYYSSLPNGYNCRNAPPASIEELLQVRGVTPELLFGNDAIKMGYAPTSGSSGGSVGGVDNSDGIMDHGWAAYLTLWSAETNYKADGTPKINLNSKDLAGLYNSLVQAVDEPTAQFVVAWRMGAAPVNSSGSFDSTVLTSSSSTSTGTSGGTTGGSGGGTGSGSATTATAKNTLGSVLDLFGAVVPTKPTSTSNSGQATRGAATFPNPFTTDSGSLQTNIPKLLDNCTVYSGQTIPGRININLAPRTVLQCIPGLSSTVIDQIISNRVQDPNSAPPDQAYPTWPLVEGIVDLPTMKALMPYVTAGGNVYRAQVIGKFDKESPTARLEVVIDATIHPAQYLYWKDLSQMSGTFPAEPTK